MKRIWSTSIAASLMLLPACKGGADVEAIKLVPDEAEFIVGLSPKAISGSDVYKEFSGMFDQEAEFKEFMERMNGCDVDPTSLDSLVIGANSDEEFVFVMVADGIGEDDTATCVMKQFQAMGGEEEGAEVTRKKRKKIIQFTDGRAYLVNKNMLAMATTAWEDTLGELIDGKAKAAVDNSKKDLIGEVDTKSAMWFIAQIPGEVGSMGSMVGLPAESANAKSVAGSVDLSKGAALDVVVRFDDEASASATAKSAQEMFDGIKTEVPDEFKGAVESVKIEAAGANVKVGVSASIDEIKAVQSLVGQFM